MFGGLNKLIWRIWERMFHSIFRLQPIAPDGSYMFYIAERTYIGRRFTVNGIEVKPFDKVIELHMNNELLAEVLQSESQIVSVAVRLIQETKRSLPILANAIDQPRFGRIRVVYGVTFIHRGIRRFGFHAFPVQSKFSKWLTAWHLRHVMRMVNPDAARVLDSHAAAFEPMLVATTKEHLLSKYGKKSNREGNAISMGDHCLT